MGADATEPFFGTDGIRDVAGEGRLSPSNLHRIGRAIATFAKARVTPSPRVLIGRDTRPSGLTLLRAIAEGMAAEGVVAEDGGVLPTPAVAWWVGAGAADLGVVLTASHNPASDNGVKVFLPGGRKPTTEEERHLDARIRAAQPSGSPAAPSPRPDACDRYVDAVVTALLEGEGLDGTRLVVDCANGATMATAPRVLAALGADVTTPMGSDPAAAINDRCGTQHPEPWLAAVRAARGDGGLAFDGDGDRVLVADADGALLDGDVLLYILATERRERGDPGSDRVVATVMSNFGLETALAATGIGVDRVPVGDRQVADRMRETGAAVGGEPSGHVLLGADVGGGRRVLIGDGVVAGVAALQSSRRRGVALSTWRARVPKCPQMLRNVPVRRKVPFEEAPAFAAAVAREEAALAGRGRVVVRYSGTEPVLRIMVEGPDDPTVAAAVARLEQASKTLA